MLITKANLVLTMLFAPAMLPANKDFKLVKQKNGISLYERPIVHNGNEVRELKADFTDGITKAATIQNQKVPLDYSLDQMEKNAEQGFVLPREPQPHCSYRCNHQDQLLL